MHDVVVDHQAHGGTGVVGKTPDEKAFVIAKDLDGDDKENEGQRQLRQGFEVIALDNFINEFPLVDRAEEYGSIESKAKENDARDYEFFFLPIVDYLPRFLDRFDFNCCHVQIAPSSSDVL